MNKKICVMLSIFLLGAISNCYAFTITQPANNSVFYPGQKVKVSVDVTQEDKIQGLMIYTYKGSSELLDGPPYEVELTLDKTYVGKGFISAISKTPDDNVLKVSIDITIQLPPDVKLVKIVTDKYNPMIKSSAGQPPASERLQASGLFSDGIERELGIVPNLQYTTSNPDVVTVDSNGTLTALNLGKAKVSIMAGDQNATVDVIVYVNININRELLVKPVETGIQLDWKLSPQDPEWVTGYMVFRTEDPDGVIKRKIADVPNGTTTYIDTTAVKGKTYYYGVQAISATANERSSMTNMTPGVLP